VSASKGKWKNYWKIKSVVDQTCVLEQPDASHRNLSSSFVASQMFAKIVESCQVHYLGIRREIKECKATAARETDRERKRERARVITHPGKYRTIA
jgi:hypothetical protein